MAKATISIGDFKNYLETNWEKLPNEKSDIYIYGENRDNQVQFNGDEGEVILSLDNSIRKFPLREWMDAEGEIRAEIAAAIIFYFEYLESANLSVKTDLTQLMHTGSLYVILNQIERLKMSQGKSNLYDSDLEDAITKYDSIYEELAR